MLKPIKCEGCRKLLLGQEQFRWYCDECRALIDRLGILNINSLDPNDPHQDLDLSRDTILDDIHNPGNPQ